MRSDTFVVSVVANLSLHLNIQWPKSFRMRSDTFVVSVVANLSLHSNIQVPKSSLMRSHALSA